MKTKLLFAIYSFITITSVYAEGGEHAAHHEPSVLDLKYPALNFVIFFGFIVWKIKKPLSDMFNKKAEDVRSLMKSAAEQSKNAEEKFQAFQDKIKNLDSETVKISTDYENEIVNYAKLQSEETATTIARMKRDVENKLAGERKEMMDGLSHELLSEVVGKTKTTINSDKNLKDKATQNIVAGIR